METEFAKAVGKGIGEVLRDIEEFLSHSCIVSECPPVDLRTLLPDLNMAEQFSFALLSEAETQGWDTERIKNFYMRACAASVGRETAEKMLSAFQNKDSDVYCALLKKYGCRFELLDHSYWSSCLALAIDSGHVHGIMEYFRLFTVCLMEFAYIDGQNPKKTYTWGYYESFRSILDNITKEPEPQKTMQPVVRALGGTAGKAEAGAYYLTLGIDIENPDKDRMAKDIAVDILLKDKDGQPILTVRDKLECIDPGTIFHYGITKKIKGAAVAGISARVRAGMFLSLSTPVMGNLQLSDEETTVTSEGTQTAGTLTGNYESPLSTLLVHYQFLDASGKIIGGGNEWIPYGLTAKGKTDFLSKVPVPLPRCAKTIFSFDFHVEDLV